LIPGLVVALSVMALPLISVLRMPLRAVSRDFFYTGLSSFADSANSVLRMFLFHDYNGPLAYRFFQGVSQVAIWLIPAIGILALAVCMRQGRFSQSPPEARCLFLATAALVGSCTFLIAAHRLFGILYPIRRTGIYWIPLFLLVCFALFVRIERPDWKRLAAASCLVASIACLVQFLSQWNVHHYAEWPYDFDTRRIVQKLIEAHAPSGSLPATIGATWNFEPSLNFYRRSYHLDWMRPVERNLTVPKGDYYVLLGEDRAL